MVRTLTNDEIRAYLIKSGKGKERKQRMRQLEECLRNAVIDRDDAYYSAALPKAGVNSAGVKTHDDRDLSDDLDRIREKMQSYDNEVENLKETIRLARSREMETGRIIRRILVCLSVLPEKEQDVLMTFYMQNKDYASAVSILENKWGRRESMILVWRRRALDELREVYNSGMNVGEIMHARVFWDGKARKIRVIHQDSTDNGLLCECE